MTKKVAITGGAGFIGGALVKELLRRGYEARILTRGAAKSGGQGVEYRAVDYASVDSIKNALEGCVGVFHLAAAIFAFNYEGFAKANIAVTENLAAAAKHIKGLEFFIYMSSQAAGGCSENHEKPRTENDAPAPVSDYGRTKLAGEKSVQNLPENIKTVIFRASIVYGKNDSGVSKIAAWVRRGIMVNTSEGDAYFNFIYVDDLARALASAITLPGAGGQVFYVGENKSYTWRYFIENMAAVMGKKKVFMVTAPQFALKCVAFVYTVLAKVFGFQPALNYDKIKEAQVKGHWVCSAKKWELLSGQKFTPLDEGLKKSF